MKIDKGKLNYKMGKRYKLVPLIEKAIAAHAEDEWHFKYTEKLQDHHWHPSSHPLLPLSTLYEIATGVEHEHEAISNSLRKTFAVGHFWHQWLQYLCVASGICKDEDVERHKLWSWGDGQYEQISGSADIVPLSISLWTGGVDFKTMNSRQFEQPEFTEFYAHKYEAQMNIYMHLFEQEHWLILCINKDNGEMKEYPYIRNQPLIDIILDKFQYVSESIAAGTSLTKIDDDLCPELPFTGPVLS